MNIHILTLFMDPHRMAIANTAHLFAHVLHEQRAWPMTGCTPPHGARCGLPGPSQDGVKHHVSTPLLSNDQGGATTRPC